MIVVGLATPSAPPPHGLLKGQGCGNWIKRRPLPLSENGLKGLLDSQSQGPPEASSMGPGWGWCTAGKWSKAGKGKNKTFHFGTLDSEPVAGRTGRGLAYPQDPAFLGHVCPGPHRSLWPDSVHNIHPQKGRVGLGEAGLCWVPGLWTERQPLRVDPPQAPLPDSLSCPTPEHVRPVHTAAVALAPLATCCPHVSSVHLDSFSHSLWL